MALGYGFGGGIKMTCFLHTYAPCWDVLRMHLRWDQVVGIPKRRIFNHKAMVHDDTLVISYLQACEV